MNFHLQKRAVDFRQREVGSEEESVDNNEYVFEIEQTIDGSAFVTSMSDNTLTFSNAEDLRVISKVKAHTATINRIESSKVSPHLVVSASDDHTLRGWDTRCFTQPVFEIKRPQEVSAVSTGLNGVLLASACESTVFFHDVRFVNGLGPGGNSPELLGSYEDAHSDVITQLKFHPTQSHILASASEDNLICTFDTSVNAMEDSVVSTFNTESPVARFNYFGENYDAIYALSTNETLSFWHHPSAQRVADFSNIREQLGVDYLVDCFGAPNSNDIYLLAGDYGGRGVVAQMLPTGFNVVGSLESGHNANIRCSSATFSVATGGAPAVRLATGGEDARLLSWSTQPVSASVSTPHHGTHSQHSHSRPTAGGNMKIKKDNNLRFKPY